MKATCTCCGQPGSPTRHFISDARGDIYHLSCYVLLFQRVAARRIPRRKAA